MTEDRSARPDDTTLVRAVVGGSYDALASLYDRHGSAVFAVACRLTSDRGVAEEVVQDTFLALWDRAESYDPAIGSLAAWLHTIARNRTIDRLRAAGRRPQLVAMSGGLAAEDSETQRLERASVSGSIVAGATMPPSPEAAYASKEMRTIIDGALADMSTEERTVIVLAYREGLTQAEIAERLGWPLGTVKTRTRRALRRLRDVLDASTSVAVGSDPADGSDR